MRKALLLAGVLLGGLISVNCGGGDDSSPATSTPSTSSDTTTTQPSDGTVTTSNVDLYLTDQNPFVLRLDVTLYTINICNDSGCQTIFNSSSGVRINVAQLNRSLQFLSSVSVPNGTYTRAEVYIKNSGYYRDYQGNQHQWTLQGCADNRCPVRVNFAQPISITQSTNIILDFDLQSLDCSTTAPVQCSLNIVPRHEDDSTVRNNYRSFKVYGIVSTDDLDVNNPSTVTLTWNDATFTGNISNSTECVINGTDYTGTQCVTELNNFLSSSGASQVCLEVNVSGDPSTRTFNVNEFELKAPEVCGLATSYTVTDPEENDQSFEVRVLVTGYDDDTGVLSFKTYENESPISTPIDLRNISCKKVDENGELQTLDVSLCATELGRASESNPLFVELEVEYISNNYVITKIIIY